MRVWDAIGLAMCAAVIGLLAAEPWRAGTLLHPDMGYLPLVTRVGPLAMSTPPSPYLFPDALYHLAAQPFAAEWRAETLIAGSLQALVVLAALALAAGPAAAAVAAALLGAEATGTPDALLLLSTGQHVGLIPLFLAYAALGRGAARGALVFAAAASDPLFAMLWLAA
ncbi:MAG: hypothetical protein AAF192_19385, partial [Pseudomonadota bacterium]